MDALGDIAKLIFVDQRGSGGSPVGTGDLSMDEYVADISAVADGLGLESFGIVGHSFGGLQAVLVALAEPERVTSVVLLDADSPTRSQWIAALSPGTPIHTRVRHEDQAEQKVLMAEEGWMFDQDKLDRWIVLEFRPFYADPATSGQVPHDFDGRAYLQWRTTSAAVRGSLGDWDLAASLPSLTCPVLLIYCRESVLGAEIPATYRDTLPNAQLVVVEGGHTPPIEDPDAFRQAVRPFLLSQPNLP